MNINFKDKKIWIGVGVFVILAFLIYQFAGNGGNADDGLFIDGGLDPIEEILGRDVLNLVDRMRNVSLDTEIFNSDTFKSLKDFSVEIPKQPTGRRDPFAPL